jgi:hypothetical protein
MVWLIGIHEHSPSGPDAIQVIIGAKHGDESHTGELHLNRRRLPIPISQKPPSRP